MLAVTRMTIHSQVSSLITVRGCRAFLPSVDTSKPIKSDGTLNTAMTYQPGGPGNIVVVRLMYQYPVYVNLLGFNLTDLSGGGPGAAQLSR